MSAACILAEEDHKVGGMMSKPDTLNNCVMSGFSHIAPSFMQSIVQLYFLSWLCCRGHRAVFEVWFLLVQCGHWIDVAAKLLVSVGVEQSEPLLFLLTFYHHPTNRGHQSTQHNVRHLAKQVELKLDAACLSCKQLWYYTTVWWWSEIVKSFMLCYTDIHSEYSKLGTSLEKWWKVSIAGLPILPDQSRWNSLKYIKSIKFI